MSTRKHGSLVDYLMAEQSKRFEMPDMSHVPADAGMDRLKDGSRVMATVRHGEYVIHAYVHGPDYFDELRRLGITTKLVRLRQEPLFNPNWTDTLHPPEVAKFWGQPIPEGLRGRTGTFVNDPFDPNVMGRAWTYKYTAVVKVRVHRPRRGAPSVPRKEREVLEVPLVWLEAAPAT